MESVGCDGVKAVTPRVIEVNSNSSVGQFLTETCGFEVGDYFIADSKAEKGSRWRISSKVGSGENSKMMFYYQRKIEKDVMKEFEPLCEELEEIFLQDVQACENLVKNGKVYVKDSARENLNGVRKSKIWKTAEDYYNDGLEIL